MEPERLPTDQIEHMTTTPANALSVRDPWSLVPPLGNLDAYISSINRLPLLSQEEETRLATELRETGDLKAASALVMSHLRLVVSVSRQYLGYGLPHGDLIQEGNIGPDEGRQALRPEPGRAPWSATRCTGSRPRSTNTS